MTQSAIATAADYAEAMLCARKAKNILWLLMIAVVLAQPAIFLVARYKIDISGSGPAVDGLHYLVAAIDFLGIATPLVLGVVLLLLTAIMLVGRLIGVSRVTAAFIWCVVLAVLLFPWQAFLANATLTSPELPGALYTWVELVARARIHPAGMAAALLFWTRFVGWPMVALIILVVIQADSRRGLRMALGETTAPVVPVAAA